MILTPCGKTLLLAPCALALLSMTGQQPAGRPGRGVVALPNEEGTLTVGWRLLASDSGDAGFHVYRRNLYTEPDYRRLTGAKRSSLGCPGSCASIRPPRPPPGVATGSWTTANIASAWSLARWATTASRSSPLLSSRDDRTMASNRTPHRPFSFAWPDRWRLPGLEGSLTQSLPGRCSWFLLTIESTRYYTL